MILVYLAGCGMERLHFNEPPSPPEVAIAPAAPTTLDTLTGSITADAIDAEGDTLSYTYRWYRNGDLQASTGSTMPASQTAHGDEWRLDVHANDGEWDSEAGSATVIIVNTAPTLTSVVLAPESPTTTDDLVATVEAEDVDDDDVTLNIHWFADDVEVPSLAGGLTVPASLTRSQQVWRVEVKPADVESEGTMASAQTKIDNTAPELDEVLIFPYEPVHGDTLATGLVGLYDADGDALEVTYTWMANGRVVATDTTTGTSYYTGEVEKGYQFSVSAQASDGFTTSPLVTSDVVTVINSAPTATGATLSPTAVYEGSTLTCEGEGGADVDSDVVTFDYDWQVNGAAISAHGETLTGSSFSRGDEVSCTVTPTDDDLEGDPHDSEIVTIQNTLPSITGVDLSTTAPTKLTGISCTPAGYDDDDGDAAAYTYAWYQNGSKVGTSTSLAGSTLSRGTSVYVEVTPYDAYGSGAAVRSSTVTVANSTPTLSSASISPTPLYTDSTATCSPSGFSDADGDTAVYTYAWYHDGVLSTETGATFSGDDFDKNDRLYCIVTPSDGTASGTDVRTSTITVSNSAPSVDATLATSASAQECDEIQLDASGTTDADDDSLTYAWTAYSKPAGSSMTTADFDTSTSVEPYVVVDAAGTFTFQVAVSDGSTSSSDTVSVVVAERPTNDAPVADAGADQSVTQTTSCTTSGTGTYCPACPTQYVYLDGGDTTDTDGDPIRYTWSYTVSGGSGVSLDSTTSETPMMTLNPMGTGYGTTSTMTVTIVLTALDCAGGRDTDALTVTYSCTGS